MKTFVGTKLVTATPMTRLDYNVYRGWQLPKNEVGADAGYLVEYTDGGNPNDDRHMGYISWSPAAQFDAAYTYIGDVTGLLPHQVRVLAEKAELETKVSKLDAFLRSHDLAYKVTAPEGEILELQFMSMVMYFRVLSQRINAFQTKATT